MMKLAGIGLLAVGLLGAVSCSPVGDFSQNQNGTPASISQTGDLSSQVPSGSIGSGERATSGELRNLREQREAAGNERLIHSGGGTRTTSSSVPSGGEAGDSDDILATLPPLDIDYRYAVPVPGRSGWVYNPFTNRPVDVRGVASGRLIYDERDPANRDENGNLRPVAQMPNKFRVP